MVISLVAAGLSLPAWGAPLAYPLRQTVPMTPPPTWTPVAPPSDPTPIPTYTRPQPPEETRLPETTPVPPTLVPTEPTTEQPPSVTPATPPTAPALAASATATWAAVAAVTPSATNGMVPPARMKARPWMGFTAEPFIIGPGSVVTLQLLLENLGTGIMEDPSVSLALPSELVYVSAQASAGTVQSTSPQIVWRLEAPSTSRSASLAVTIQVVPDVLPDNELHLQGRLAWSEGRDRAETVSNVVVLILPWALLPETGGVSQSSEY
jgi:hypothetical protein